MDEIEALQKQLDAEKRKNELLRQKEEKEAKKKALKKQLNFYKRENNPALKKLKRFASGVGTVLDNIDTNMGKNKSGCDVGDTVTITNGAYMGQKMKISSFIPGGIQGSIAGQTIRIRHGSYYKG